MKCLCGGICSTLCLCVATFLGGEALQDLDCREWYDRIVIEVSEMDCVLGCPFEMPTIEPEALDEDDAKDNIREAEAEPAL